MSVRVLGVIPVRMDATRFPGKPLALLAGRPMVQWVHEAATSSDTFDDIVVATPDDAIAEVAEGFGARVVRTSARHETGTDRVAEAAAAVAPADVVVNVQGDQPFVTAAMLAAVTAPFRSGDDVPMATVGAPIEAGSPAWSDPDTVKVVCDLRGDALYFSRSPIPFLRTTGDAPVLHHIGLYGFTRLFLDAYAALRPTPLERREGLEQLRVLEHGFRIRVGRVDKHVIEVNTPQDMEAAERFVLGGGA